MSFVLPVHNAQSTVGLAMSSILCQSHTNFEVIAIDDGSEDDTVSIVSAYRDKRVRVYSKPQGGPSSARNEGLRRAEGEFIAFADDDDYLFPDYLARSLELLPEGRSVVTNNAWLLYPGGISPKVLRHSQPIPSPNRQTRAILRSNFVPILSVFPASLVSDIGFFDESLQRVEDWDFWIRAILAGWKIVHQAVPLALVNRTQISQSSSLALVAEAQAVVLGKALTSGMISASDSRYIHRRLRVGEPNLLMTRADELVEAGLFAEAARSYYLATSVRSDRRLDFARAFAFRAVPPLFGRLKLRAMRRRAQLGYLAPVSKL